MDRTLSREQFLKIAGGGAAVASLFGIAGCEQTKNRPKQTSSKRTGPPSNTSRPDTNVVLVVIDSLRKDYVGAYGNDQIKTPTFDALAKESLSFTQAYPESLPTICARRAIHTGFRTWPFRDWHPPEGENVILEGWQPIPDDQATLAEILKANGYYTMFVTDNLQQFKPSYNFQRGFKAYEFIRGQTSDSYQPLAMLQPEKIEQALLSGPMAGLMRQYFANTANRKTEEDWFSPQVFSRASQYLEAAKESQPFFLAVDSYDVHEPWDPPEEYTSLYDRGYDGLEPYAPDYGSSDYLTERQLQRMRALYSGELTMMDRWLGRFLKKMDELDLSENTLLVVISDHGVLHGEHGVVGKLPPYLWPELTDIPFLIRHPEGRRAGETSDYYASTHDVAPTILGFLGIEPPKPMDGQNLSVLFEGGGPEGRPHFTLGYNTYVWTRDDRYVMSSNNYGRNARLYDLEDDPEMKNDIAEENPDLVDQMYNDYVLKDAGGALPRYDLASLRRAARTP